MGPIALLALVVALLGLGTAVVVLLRLRRLIRSRRSGSDGGGSLELLGDLRRIESELAALAERIEAVDGRGRSAVQRVGVVRFNPFEDTGSNQSFALALLDAHADGLVLSSLHSRQQTRLFIKSITAGKSETPLSSEETEALRRAGLAT